MCSSDLRTAVQLAEELGLEVAVLTSLLRVVAGLGFLDVPAPGHYALNERGELLRRERFGPLATFVGAPDQWDPWARLRDAVAWILHSRVTYLLHVRSATSQLMGCRADIIFM